jgi:release factor glutamine methyltransferase
VLDLGTGSGCLIVCLSRLAQKEGIHLECLAVDASEAALEVARLNAKQHKQDGNITFFHSNWFSQIPPEKHFDLILANPPYIAPNDTQRSAETDYEPKQALFAENNGLKDIESILSVVNERLETPGALFLECGHEQGQAIESLLLELGFDAPDWKSHIHRDLAGRTRVIELRKF